MSAGDGGMSVFGNCALCSSPLALHLYLRIGPVPGNIKVCTNDDCEGSLKGMERETLRRFESSVSEEGPNG